MLRPRVRRMLCLTILVGGLLPGFPAVCASIGDAGDLPDAALRARAPADFRKAKRLMREIYAGLEMSFYCGCRYENGGAPDASTCGYRPHRPDKRSRRIEWEHVVPAAWLGRERECWNRPVACRRANGKDRPRRACCRRIDSEFRLMEGDPHNLVPAIGELNARRLDFPFGDIPGEARAFGACDFEVGAGDDSEAAFGRSRGLVEPRPEIRGDIARIHFYMIDQYGVPIETNYLKMLQEWARLDRVSPIEKLRNERIRERTGLNNPFVSGELE
ncbi:MAG: endonuclease [bacterium]|nr:endonuclease [bacterium]